MTEKERCMEVQDTSIHCQPCHYQQEGDPECPEHNGFCPRCQPEREVLREELCWCGGEVGTRVPGDALGVGCLLDITHNWRAASQESQDIIEAKVHTVYERPNEQHPWNSVNLGSCSCPAEQDHYTDETPEALKKRLS